MQSQFLISKLHEITTYNPLVISKSYSSECPLLVKEQVIQNSTVELC